MAKGDERPESGIEEPTRHVFDRPATLREPAAPHIPRVQQSSSVPVVPLPGEDPEAPPGTLQEAREATDTLLRELLEEDLDGAPEPRREEPPAQSSLEEDWPAELHSLHLPEEQ